MVFSVHPLAFWLLVYDSKNKNTVQSRMVASILSTLWEGFVHAVLTQNQSVKGGKVTIFWVQRWCRLLV